MRVEPICLNGSFAKALELKAHARSCLSGILLARIINGIILRISLLFDSFVSPESVGLLYRRSHSSSFHLCDYYTDETPRSPYQQQKKRASRWTVRKKKKRGQFWRSWMVSHKRQLYFSICAFSSIFIADLEIFIRHTYIW